jgi:hypothetical protein
MDPSPTTFEEFWPQYVRAHQNKWNRTLHAIGIGLALACVAAAILKRRPWLAAFAPVFAYGFAWFGHFFIEKNKPATFSHPMMSARAGALMFWKTICGEMDAEVARVLDDAERSGAPASGRVPADAIN